MGWPKGVKLSAEHKRKIRASVKETVPLRRKRRTKAQRRRDAELDPRSLGKRVLTPRPEWWKEGKGRVKVRDGIKVHGVKGPEQEVPTILGGRIKLLGHGRMIQVRAPYEADSQGRRVVFV